MIKEGEKDKDDGDLKRYGMSLYLSFRVIFDKMEQERQKAKAQGKRSRFDED